ISNVYGSVTSSPPAVLTVIDSPVDITSDLKAWYNLDEGTFLVAYDVSGNGNDGTLQGFVDDDSQWVTGRINGGLNFNPAGSGVRRGGCCARVGAPEWLVAACGGGLWPHAGADEALRQHHRSGLFGSVWDGLAGQSA